MLFAFMPLAFMLLEFIPIELGVDVAVDTGVDLAADAAADVTADVGVDAVSDGLADAADDLASSSPGRAEKFAKDASEAGIMAVPPPGAFPIGISVQGFAALQRALGRVANGVQPELRRRLREIGDNVGIVASHYAPRRTGALQTSIRTRVTNSSASIYSTAIYGGAINSGAWTKYGRGPHIARNRASHYMDRSVDELASWVQDEMEGLLDWVVKTFEED